MHLNDDVYRSLWQRSPNLELTGKGAVMAMIDLPLWRHNPVYRCNITQARWIGALPEGEVLPAVHSAAAASIAVGAIGVAQLGNLVYYGFDAEGTFANDRRPVRQDTLVQNTIKAIADGLTGLRNYVDKGFRMDCICISNPWPFSYFPQNKIGDHERRCQSLAVWFEQRNIPVFHPLDAIACPIGPRGVPDYLSKDRRIACRPRYAQEYPAPWLATPMGYRDVAVWSPRAKDYFQSNTFFDDDGATSLVPAFLSGLFLLARQKHPTMRRKNFARLLAASAKEIVMPDGQTMPAIDMESFVAHTHLHKREIDLILASKGRKMCASAHL